jgi:hypothetical protein
MCSDAMNLNKFLHIKQHFTKWASSRSYFHFGLWCCDTAVKTYNVIELIQFLLYDVTGYCCRFFFKFFLIEFLIFSIFLTSWVFTTRFRTQCLFHPLAWFIAFSWTN